MFHAIRVDISASRSTQLLNATLGQSPHEGDYQGDALRTLETPEMRFWKRSPRPLHSTAIR